jgi:hypothetical protein
MIVVVMGTWMGDPQVEYDIKWCYVSRTVDGVHVCVAAYGKDPHGMHRSVPDRPR